MFGPAAKVIRNRARRVNVPAGRAAVATLLACLAGIAGADEPASAVVHKSRGVRPEERAAYERLLAEADAKPDEEIHTRARAHRTRRAEAVGWTRTTPFPVYRDLIASPEAYEQRPVTFRGTLRRVTRLGDDPPRWESWLFPDDADGNPAVFVSKSPPSGIAVDENAPLREPTEVTARFSMTGLFLKLYGYEAGDGPRFAPLLLAGPMTPLDDGPPSRTIPDWAVYAVIAVAGLYATWRITRVVGKLRPRATRDDPELPEQLPTTASEDRETP